MNLSKVQTKIISFIRHFVRQQGYSPSIREIMRHCGFKSPRAVSFHLEKLKEGRWIRSSGKARSILLNSVDDAEAIPIYGSIPAGFPELQTQGVVAELAIRAGDFSAGVRRGGYALKVRGDSMEGARIFDGDLAIVEPKQPKTGDIVVAMIDGESTLKRLVKHKDRFFLKAENPKYSKLIPSDELKVQGVVVGVYRALR